jgi:hypothetical protein
MPHEYILQTQLPVGLAEILLAANSVDPDFGIRGIGGTDTLQISLPDGLPLVTILPSAELSRRVDPITLGASATEHSERFWTEAFAPWESSPLDVAVLLERVATACKGHVTANRQHLSESRS